MALILSIDTSTAICSVTLAKDGELISIKENNDGLNHSLLLGSYTNDILKENGLEAINLDAVAVSMGPGSYTGLRIGVSLAKGLCFGASIPLIAINTLQAMAHSVSTHIKEDALYCPMIDARRMEVYTALYNKQNEAVMDVQAKIIDPDSFKEELLHSTLFFFGNGSEKTKEIISSPNAHFIEGVETSAKNIIPLAENKYLAKQFEDVAYFEPFYLKDFIATTPKNKVIDKRF